MFSPHISTSSEFSSLSKQDIGLIETQAIEISVGKVFGDPQWQKLVFPGFYLSITMGFGDCAPPQRDSGARRWRAPHTGCPSALRICPLSHWTKSHTEPSVAVSGSPATWHCGAACTQRVPALLTATDQACLRHCECWEPNVHCFMRSWLSCKVGNIITIIHARDLRLQESAIAAEYGPPTQVWRPQPQVLATKLPAAGTNLSCCTALQRWVLPYVS